METLALRFKVGIISMIPTLECYASPVVGCGIPHPAAFLRKLITPGPPFRFGFWFSHPLMKFH